MSRPTIGFLIPRLGITDRGAEVFVYEIAQRLQADFDVVVWVRKSNNKSELLGNLVKRGVTIRKVSCIPEQHLIAKILYIFPFLRNIINKLHISPSEIEMLSFSAACLPALLSEKVDLLFPANGVWGSILCRLIRTLKRTPFIYATLGGIEPVSLWQKPNMCIALFPSIERWLRKHFPYLRVCYISTGVDLKKFHPHGDKAFIDLPRPVFLTVSALVPEKEVDLTVRAVGRLKIGSLLVIGDGPLKSALVHLADTELGRGRYMFVSSGHSKLHKYYRAADVFAFSAPWETGWSIVFLEALASGLPVVANKGENLEYLLGKDWPLFCNVSNINQYSRTLERAAKIKVVSRPLVQNYSWEKIAEQYKEIILGIANDYKKKD